MASRYLLTEFLGYSHRLAGSASALFSEALLSRCGTVYAILNEQCAPEIHLPLPPQSWDYRHALPCLTSYVGSGDQNSYSMLVLEALYLTEPAPKFSIFFRSEVNENNLTHFNYCFGNFPF